jgi:predicted neutral ceramidase superfamily lipid hydrolase
MRSMMYVEKILQQVSIYSVLLPVIVGLVYFKKLDSNSRLAELLLIFASIPQLMSVTKWGYNTTLYNGYMLVDAILWGYIFYRNSKNSIIRGSIIVIIAVQVAVSIYIFSKTGINSGFHSEFVCWSNIVQSLLVLSFFYERYKREEILALEKEPMFWFCLGILIYAPATYFRFAYYQKVGETDYGLKSLHHLPNAGMYLVFTVGLFVNVLRTSKFRNVFIRNQS